MSSEEKSKRRKVRAIERDARDFQLTLDDCARFKPKSSNIVEVAYSVKGILATSLGTLYVNFNSSPDWYEYQNVEKFVFEGLLTAESPGNYLREKVFGNDYYLTTKLVLTEGLVVDEPEPKDEAKTSEGDEAHIAESKPE